MNKLSTGTPAINRLSHPKTPPFAAEQALNRLSTGTPAITHPSGAPPAALASLRLPAGRAREDLLASFRSVEEIRVAGGREPSTQTDRAGKPGMLVAGIREARDQSSFWLWAVNDNLQSGTAQNAVRIAESLLAQGFGRGDQ